MSFIYNYFYGDSPADIPAEVRELGTQIAKEAAEKSKEFCERRRRQSATDAVETTDEAGITQGTIADVFETLKSRPELWSFLKDENPPRGIDFFDWDDPRIGYLTDILETHGLFPCSISDFRQRLYDVQQLVLNSSEDCGLPHFPVSFEKLGLTNIMILSIPGIRFYVNVNGRKYLGEEFENELNTQESGMARLRRIAEENHSTVPQVFKRLLPDLVIRAEKTESIEIVLLDPKFSFNRLLVEFADKDGAKKRIDLVRV